MGVGAVSPPSPVGKGTPEARTAACVAVGSQN